MHDLFVLQALAITTGKQSQTLLRYIPLQNVTAVRCVAQTVFLFFFSLHDALILHERKHSTLKLTVAALSVTVNYS